MAYEEDIIEAFHECLPWMDYDPRKNKRPLTQAEILVDLRGNREHRHRNWQFTISVRKPFDPFFPLVRPAPVLTLDVAQECCNKSTAVYSLVGPDRRLLLPLQNYLYRAWLRPYRNNVEFSDFIAKVIVPQPINNSGVSYEKCLEAGQSFEKISDAILKVGELHRYIGDGAERVLDKAEELVDNADRVMNTIRPIPAEYENWGVWKMDDKSLFKYRTLRPLFRALIIVVAEYDYYLHRTYYKDDFGQQRVYLLRTGYTEGLSEAITFEALHTKGQLLDEPKYERQDTMMVQTTLKAATQFILDLEKREQQAFGPPLELESVTLDTGEIQLARANGWTGSEVLDPSSSWVDTSLFPDWLGEGAWLGRLKNLEEEEQRRRFDRSMGIHQKDKQENGVSSAQK